MDYFWTHKDNISEGMGYGQFTWKHLLYLAAVSFFVIGSVMWYLQADQSGRILFLRTIGAVLILIDIIKMVLIAFSDVKFEEYLPLEICSFAAYFIVCDSIFIGNTFFPEMLLTLFLPAAIMAVLFPTTSTLPAVNFYSIHQFLYHGLIIAYIIARFAAKEIPLTYPGVWLSILKIIVLAAVIYAIDCRFDKNFMFLRDTYGNPMLEAIRRITGDGIAYTGGLVCFCIIMIHVFFALFKCIDCCFYADFPRTGGSLLIIRSVHPHQTAPYRPDAVCPRFLVILSCVRAKGISNSGMLLAFRYSQSLSRIFFLRS